MCDDAAVFEIGNSLREARIAPRDRPRRRPSSATKIRGKYLRALEEEQFEQLPSETYVKGFLRTYADYLGLDGQLYVDEFNSRFVSGEDYGERPRRSSAGPSGGRGGSRRAIVLVAVALVAIVDARGRSGRGRSSGSGNEAAAADAGHAHHAKQPRLPPAYLPDLCRQGSSYVAVHRGGPAGQLLFQGTIDKGTLEPFTRQAASGST